MHEGVGSSRRWRNRDLVRERDHRRAWWLWQWMLALTLILFPATAYLLQQNESLKLSYEVNALRAENERLLELERRLSVQRASLESLESVERWAVGSHGLVHPTTMQVVVVRVAARARGELLARHEGTPRALARGGRPPAQEAPEVDARSMR